MGGNGYALRHAWPGAEHVSGRYVVEAASGRLLAGVGHDPHRAWVFPLNTPRGIGVVQEYPFDHPYHNAVFVGQAMVRVNGRESHFWAPTVDWRAPTALVYQNVGQIRYGYDQPVAVEPRDRGFRFVYTAVWCDEQGTPMLDEVRTIDVHDGDDATICDVVSTKTAAYGPIDFGVDKHSSIGVRVQPQLLPFMGGQIVAGEHDLLRRGLADEVAFDKACDFVAYEADVPVFGRFGVCLIALANSASPRRDGPWFIRDYGLAMFNPTMHEPIETPDGESWTAGLRVVAYDGAVSLERARAWRPPS